MRREVAAYIQAPDATRGQAAPRKTMSLITPLKRLARKLLVESTRTAFRWRSALAYRLWGVEGINRMLVGCRSEQTAELLTRFGAAIGPESDLHSPLIVHNALTGYGNLRIGAHCHLGKEVLLDLREAIEIEDRVTVSMRATILTHTDVGHSPLGSHGFGASQAPVRLKRGAYLGAQCTVLQGVTVGECAVVAAGAVVVGDVPPCSVVAGVPARVIKTLDEKACSGEWDQSR